jgi:hypothetical protein
MWSKVTVNTCPLISRAFGGGVLRHLATSRSHSSTNQKITEKWFRDCPLILMTNHHAETRGGRLPFHFGRAGVSLLLLEHDTDRRKPDKFSVSVYLYVNSFTCICARDNNMSNYILILSQCR